MTTNANKLPSTTIKCAAGLIGASGSGVIEYTDCGIAGREAAAIEYDVTWLASHQWVKGGKLPGIYGGGQHPFDPAHIPNGMDGFTIRPMFNADAGLSLYLWDMKAGPYGRGPNARGVFRAGCRQRVRVEVRLNTPGVDDGFAAIDVDGTRVLQVTDLMARATSAMKLSGCFFCVFYGGAAADYAPTTDQYITIGQVQAV